MSLPSNASLASNSGVTSPIGTGTSLWDQALAKLSDPDKASFNVGRHDRRAILEDILFAVNEKKRLCLERRWKFTNSKGNVVIVRDLFEKMIKWVSKFKEVVDVAVQYDPSHASLPWAAVRTLLQITVNEIETFGAMMESLEEVTNVITRYAIVENLYLQQSPPANAKLEDAIVKLYAAVLLYLSQACRYYGRRSGVRMARSVIHTADAEVQSYVSRIVEEEKRVNALLQLQDAQNQNTLMKSSHSVQNRVVSLSTAMQALQVETASSFASLGQILTRAEAKSESLDIAQQRLLDILQTMNGPMIRVVDQVWALHDHLDRQKRMNILRWISTAQYRKHHRNLSKDLVPDSGSWLRRKQAFVEWNNSSSSSILWLRGIPGSGKTRLVSSVIQKIEEQTRSNPATSPLAYFYCARDSAEPERANPEEIIRALLKQLSSPSPDYPIKAAVLSAYNHKSREADLDGSDPDKLTVAECSQLILEITNDVPVTIVIDALDECDYSRRYQLLKVLDEIVASSSNIVKIFVSSREDTDIALRLKDLPNICIGAADNGEDIEKFIRLEVQAAKTDKRLLNGRVSAELQEKIVSKLIEGTQGMFLWVSLQIQQLCDAQRMKIEQDVVKELGRLPATLAQLYSMALAQINASGPAGRRIALNTLQWLLHAHSTLSTESLVLAVNLSCGVDGTHMTPVDILNLCCNLVVVDSELDVFRFAHLSLREYLETREEFSPMVAHPRLAEDCLRVCSGDLRDVGPNPDLWRARSLRRYAALYWPMHFHRSRDVANPSLEAALQHALLSPSRPRAFFNMWMALVSRFEPYSFKGIWLERVRESISQPPNPIFLAAAFGFAGILKSVLASGHTDLELRNQSGHTALTISCNYGCIDTATILITHGANVEHVFAASDPKYYHYKSRLDPNPLSAAAEYASIYLVKRLIEAGANVNDSCALPIAASKGDMEMVRLLLGYGANVNKVSFRGSALGAAARNNHLEIFELLLYSGADLKSIRTTSEIAAYKGHNRILRLLLEYSAETHVDCSWYESALNSAASGGRLQTVELLLGSGADVGSVDKLGHALQAAAASKVNSQSIIEILSARGANIATEARPWDNALTAAVRHANEKAVRVLLDEGAQVVQDGFWVLNALVAAAQEGNLEFVKAIVEKVLELGQPDLYQSLLNTALRSTVSPRRTNGLSSWLLEQGADVNGTDKDGTTALHLAANSNQRPLARQLLENGARTDVISRRYGSPLQALILGNPFYVDLQDPSKPENLEFLQELLDAGVNINAQGGPYGNALQAAVVKGPSGLVRDLLRRGARFIVGSGEFDNPLQAAAAKGSQEMITTLLDTQADIDTNSGRFGTALQAAACKGRFPAASLLEHASKEDAVQSRLAYRDYTRSIGYRNLSKHYESFQLLIHRGADPGIIGGVYGTALQAAAYTGNVRVVKTLLSMGVGVNQQGGFYGNALQAAACGDSDDLWGPDTFWKDKFEARSNDRQMLEAKRNDCASILKLLLEAGADVSSVSGFFGTALQAAAYSADLVLVDILLESGARVVGSKCGFYGNPIRAAIGFGRTITTIQVSDKLKMYEFEAIVSRLLKSVPEADREQLVDEHIQEARKENNVEGADMLMKVAELLIAM